MSRKLLEKNLTNLILIIAKLGVGKPDCPLNEILLGQLLDIYLPKESVMSEIITRFKNGKDKLDKIYIDSGSSFKEALKNKDKAIFKHIDIIPMDLLKGQGSKYFHWFSNFITNGIEPRTMEHVWKYISIISTQIDDLIK